MLPSRGSRWSAIPIRGKTALFNALTGARQKVANYAGVTVERKEGRDHARRTAAPCRCWTCPAPIRLRARSPDEVVTRDVVLGRLQARRRRT